MAQFTVRVELHHASTYIDYQTLHDAMARAGFSRTIAANGGNNFHLPSAEYFYSSPTENYLQVCDKAWVIGNAVKMNPAVLVTEGQIAFRGLTQAI